MKTIQNVQDWFDDLLMEGVAFHPDIPFEDLVKKDGHPTYTPFQAEHLNAKMTESFEIADKHGKDLYDIGCNAYDDYESKFKKDEEPNQAHST